MCVIKHQPNTQKRLNELDDQDYASALWSIGVRIADATRADVERAIVDRTIVRTWPMRGTLHFITPYPSIL